jgi:LPXTG-motif cell wall-anchored protein
VAAESTPVVTPVAAERPAGAVKGEHKTGHANHKATPKKVLTAQSAPVAAAKPAVQAAQAQQLPFTGLDSGAIAGLGVLLTGAGLVLRRRTREPEGELTA